MKIFYSPEFTHKYRQLPVGIRSKAKNKEKIFRENPFDKRLKTHKLQGRWNGFWAFSIDFKHRIIFTFEKSNVVRFYSIGGHSIYF